MRLKKLVIRVIGFVKGFWVRPFWGAHRYLQALENKRLKSYPHASTSNITILLLGNCQVQALARIMLAQTGDAEVTAVTLQPDMMNKLLTRDETILAQFARNQLIFIHFGVCEPGLLEKNFPEHFPKIRFIPKIDYAAFHPDMDYVENASGVRVMGPLGTYQSMIVFLAWKQKLTAAETHQLFCRQTFEALGYFEYASVARNVLVSEGAVVGIDLEPLIDQWARRGCWMYSMNHPKLFVMADIARILLEREGIKTLPGVEEFVDDQMNTEYVWPVYPEIGERLGLTGHYLFKRAKPYAFRDLSVSLLTLEQFIEASFKVFSAYAPEALTCHRLGSVRYDAFIAQLGSNVSTVVPAVERPSALSIERPAEDVVGVGNIGNATSSNPYTGLPDHQFWRRAIEKVVATDVNPVVEARFNITRESKVATAGSCFAQHISRTLTAQGFNYLVTEDAGDIPSDLAIERQFGVFSARFGNLYSARQLLQLFDRAYGHFSPADSAWTRGDGKLVDPFRPQIEPQGFSSIEALEQSREAHFVAVREMFAKLDVFVFTLGLTEAWQGRIDGAVFPLAPGVVAGAMDDKRYGHVNFSVREVVEDLQRFIDKLSSVNPAAKVIFTVSPVPLIATWENQHVLVATTYSKAVLRAAVGEMTKNNPNCDYFPSYEMITGNYTRGQYFEDDLRTIKQAGVEHVMRLFLSAYANKTQYKTETSSNQRDIMNEILSTNHVICDEEAIDERKHTSI